VLLRDILWNNSVLDEGHRQTLFILWKRDEPLSNEERGKLWLVATGAENQLQSNRGYY
jgi:hypothetical protein